MIRLFLSFLFALSVVVAGRASALAVREAPLKELVGRWLEIREQETREVVKRVPELRTVANLMLLNERLSAKLTVLAQEKAIERADDSAWFGWAAGTTVLHIPAVVLSEGARAELEASAEWKRLSEEHSAAVRAARALPREEIERYGSELAEVRSILWKTKREAYEDVAKLQAKIRGQEVE